MHNLEISIKSILYNSF